jgi:hypothetical protein
MDVRGRGFAKVDALCGDMDLVPPGRHLVDEPVGNQPVAVGSVVGQQGGWGQNEQGQRQAPIMAQKMNPYACCSGFGGPCTLACP